MYTMLKFTASKSYMAIKFIYRKTAVWCSNLRTSWQAISYIGCLKGSYMVVKRTLLQYVSFSSVITHLIWESCKSVVISCVYKLQHKNSNGSRSVSVLVILMVT
jgi:hypothetical protein